MSVTRAEFAKQYHELVEGREFVEDKVYYARSINRFWQAFDKLQRLDLPPHAKAIDIGGGIMAVLLSKILGMDACVGDVQSRAADDVSEHGLKFQFVDLNSDDKTPSDLFDLVVLQEVIEHIPQPPYIIFRRIMKFMKPGGYLFITTPNGTRVRNILYMLFNKRILDNFQYPEPGVGLGHIHEYTLPALQWQLNKSGIVTRSAEQYDDGWEGATVAARVAHMLEKPANFFPHLRDGLMFVAQRPAAS